MSKKNEIIKVLKKEQRLSTTRISAMIYADHYTTIKYLEELETEGIIKKDVETIATYWKIK